MGKILVIDDDDGVRETIANAFRESGFAVDEAVNGLSGLKIFEEEAPDLVLVDVFMPVMDGIETLLQIRSQDKNVPVIVVSGGGRGIALQFLKMAQKLGADRTIEKPFVMTDLVGIASELMRPRP